MVVVGEGEGRREEGEKWGEERKEKKGRREKAGENG